MLSYIADVCIIFLTVLVTITVLFTLKNGKIVDMNKEENAADDTTARG